jgi:hypothetical protein
MEGNITTMFPNITTPPSEPEKTPLYVGFICASLAVVLYGTTYIPVKKYDTGDGKLFILHQLDRSTTGINYINISWKILIKTIEIY